jgi:hypothetical protein
MSAGAGRWSQSGQAPRGTLAPKSRRSFHEMRCNTSGVRRLQRLAVLTLIGAVVAGSAAVRADAALFFLFSRASAAPNDRVALRVGGTPAEFTARQRVKPLARVRVYLFRNALIRDVRSRFDRRLAYVGTVVLDRNGHGVPVTFSLPPLDAGDYALAYWCPSCAAYSRGRTFFVQDVREFVEPYRSQALLHVAWPRACPVTLPNGNRPPGQPTGISWYGNGLLWAGLTADGIYAVPADRVDPGGAIGTKLLWVTAPPWRAPTLTGERLDEPSSPLHVVGMNRGSFRNANHPSFMSPVVFPSAGCWRLTARDRDVGLTYVVSVVVR